MKGADWDPRYLYVTYLTAPHILQAEPEAESEEEPQQKRVCTEGGNDNNAPPPPLNFDPMALHIEDDVQVLDMDLGLPEAFGAWFNL